MINAKDVDREMPEVDRVRYAPKVRAATQPINIVEHGHRAKVRLAKRHWVYSFPIETVPGNEEDDGAQQPANRCYLNDA